MTTPSQVFSAVAAAFGVEDNFITTKSRIRWVAYARFAAWHILRTRKRYLSLERLGWMSGRRDHTAVIHGVERAGDMLLNDEEFREAYKAAVAVIDQESNITTIYT